MGRPKKIKDVVDGEVAKSDENEEVEETELEEAQETNDQVITTQPLTIEPAKEIQPMKTLDVTDIKDAEEKISDIKTVGNGDMFKLLCKASSKSEGWMKSTKACEIPGSGCLVQVTTQQGDNVAEAITFVPRVKIIPDVKGGYQLTSY